NKKGQYPFLCTLFGHAKAGMKGKFAVAVAPVKTTTVTTTQPPPPPPPPPPTGTVGTGNTTVQVGMFEYGYTLSQASIPSGQITFVIRNNGNEVHNFSIQGVKVGTILNPGATETYTVALPPQRFNYVCDVPFHIDRGMIGNFSVTP
ncbi:MAG TPA: cupredoxin domain-containing protein, partial [Gaiellaceae bacterium]|nr:cupredoxin domain-containing protein [Gaiellaceae bacterium]